jgi:hypothetical protein
MIDYGIKLNLKYFFYENKILFIKRNYYYFL